MSAVPTPGRPPLPRRTPGAHWPPTPARRSRTLAMADLAAFLVEVALLVGGWALLISGLAAVPADQRPVATMLGGLGLVAMGIHARSSRR